MADSPQLTADKTTAKPGELITFTWTWGGPNDGTDVSGHSLTFQLKARRSGSIDFEVIESGIGQNARTIQTAYPADNPDWVMYKISAFYIAEGSTTYEYNSAAWLVSRYDSGTEEPAPASGGRLEQFQNSAAELIYPRTIIEGVFRQSDGKPLSELLSGIELPLRIEEGGTGADNAQTALANLIDGTDTSFQAASYGDVYIPISINGAGYRMPFTKVQLWTIGDRKSAVNQANTDYGIFMARGIAAGTSDYAAGSTAMTSGTIYLVYE